MDYQESMTTNNYRISISNSSFENRCTLFFDDGNSIDVQGDQLGINFNELSPEQVSSYIKNRLEDIKLQDRVQNSPIADLPQNQDYYILSETKGRAVGFNPLAPDKLVIWERNVDGGYINGSYGNTLNLFELADLRFLGIDANRVISFLISVEFDYLEHTGERVEPVRDSKKHTTTLQSIVTHPYGPDPITHIISATSMRTGADVLEDLKKELDAHGLMPDTLMLDEFWEEKDDGKLPEDAYFQVSTRFGENEGTYLDISCWARQEQHWDFALGKTPESSADAFMRMSEIGSTIQLLLNGNGRTYELTQEKAAAIENTRERAESTPVSEKNTTSLHSVVTERYEINPTTHYIMATYTRTGADILEDLKKELDAHGLMPDYYLTVYDNGKIPEDVHFDVLTEYGESGGIYIDISYVNGNGQSTRFATGKTLDETADAFMRMSRIGATIQLLLNGNGRIYELTQEKALSAQRATPAPAVRAASSLLQEMVQPLLDEIEEYENDFDIQVKFQQEGKSPNEIAQYLAETREIIRQHQLPEYDDPFVPDISLAEAKELGDSTSSLYPVTVHNPYSDTYTVIGYVEDGAYTFSIDENKAFQALNEVLHQKEETKMPKPIQRKENFTKEQLARAKDVDLLNYVQSHGYQIKPHGSVYKLMEGEHDSTIIFPETNSWCNMVSGIGGDTVSFLVKHENKNMVDAVKELIGETFDPQKLFVKNKPSAEQVPKVLVLPSHAENNNRVFAYLIKTRALDRDLVRQCVENGQLYQSAEVVQKGDNKFTFNNCIFVGFDENNTARYASQRSVNNDSAYSYKADVKNSDKQYGFLLKGKEDATWLSICEAPIDVLSLATLNKIRNQANSDEHILSLGGVSDKAIDQFLESNHAIKVINICLDNDVPGRAAGERIKEKYTELGYTIVESYPKEKDYNLQLKQEIARQNAPVIDQPDKAPNNRLTIRHLTETKQLNEDVVRAMIADGLIYQADKDISKNNQAIKISETVFVEKDENGIPIYAISVNHNGNVDKADFKKEYKNPEQARSYLSHVGKNSDLLVFNNPVSMLTHISYATDIRQHNYLCCIDDPASAVKQFTADHPNITKVRVMLDQTKWVNPTTKREVDYRELAFDKIKKNVSSKTLTVEKKYPVGIDLNRDVAKVKANNQAKMAPTNKNELQSFENEQE